MSEARCMLHVRGLDCPKEVDSLTAALNDQVGVSGLGFDLIHGTMTVDYDDDLVDPEAIIRRIADRTGLQSTPEGGVERTVPSWWSRHGACWVITLQVRGCRWPWALAASMGSGALGWEQAGGDRLARVAYALAVVVGGIGIFPPAARNLARLRFDIDVLMGLAILGAMGLGQWDEAATVAFLYGLSEALEGLSLDYARRSIRALLELAPPTAERIDADGTTQVVAAMLRFAGATVPWFAPGNTIPVDGTVALGRSSVDQKTITGESVPVLRTEGDPVYAGTINGDGTLEVTAAGAVGDALISRVVAQVRASQGRPRHADRLPNLAVRCDLYAAGHRLVAVGHARSTLVGPGLEGRPVRLTRAYGVSGLVAAW